MFQPFLKYLETELFTRFPLRSLAIAPELEYQVSQRGKNPAMIESWCYQCPQFRKIRYTYINAGETAQIFNSVIYPSYNYDLPLLGIDFLAFGKKKILVVLDFQPLFREPEYLEKYIEPMGQIRDKYQDLAQNLPMKFYDANQYFSKYLLFAKTDGETVVNRLFPAYQEYIQLYWQLLEKAEPLTKSEEIEKIIKAQKDYDQYSAERDPASGLFSSYFGHEWSEKFLYQFLFEDAVPSEKFVGAGLGIT
ncbi:MAG: 15,16-dihydrobiliverdin:ferredoxin oxidoreductase [Gomphosphaeria aponina SAG 52.96 = DSM 107014]|uniref:15,16-dihydrobiliverdin:ferredoxin oxidoreductase n=1 Tax=Gomphosphaeria aponina SAG 52.96 = DSM 107014 TaxID=1521640 RepID=A0A941GRB2_9CHRO|nr:15,16-dihydrobiliverdin:ferredoxin oxidoreductase [Gomphosphaeria aponina SAG 52.96 = DSM 107014]